MQEGSRLSGVSPSVTFLCFPMKDRRPSVPATANGKEAGTESARQSAEYDSQDIGVSVDTVAGAGLCCEDDCTSVMCSGLGTGCANGLRSAAQPPCECSVSSGIEATRLSWQGILTGSRIKSPCSLFRG